MLYAQLLAQLIEFMVAAGFDPAYNAQTAVDEAAHIIVAAELGNTAADANWLLSMIQMVGSNLAKLPAVAIADAGYRSEENFKNTPIRLVVALGREGKEHAEIDPQQYPHTAAMTARLKTDEGQQAYSKRKWIRAHTGRYLSDGPCEKLAQGQYRRSEVS